LRQGGVGHDDRVTSLKNAALVRIAVSSSSFREPLEARTLTQLEWIERCATLLGVDGVLFDTAHFPRTDAEYAAQLRKVTIDLGTVPLGLDSPELLEPSAAADARDAVLGLAAGIGTAVIRTVLPAPGPVPPASFAKAVAAAKALSRAAKAINVTVLIAAAPGTLGEDLLGVKHVLKDVDSAWLRACPNALVDDAALGSRDRYPAFVATPDDDPHLVVARRSGAWVILDALPSGQPWDVLGGAIGALRKAEAERRLAAGT
jgi:hypothetical protein